MQSYPPSVIAKVALENGASCCHSLTSCHLCKFLARRTSHSEEVWTSFVLAMIHEAVEMSITAVGQLVNIHGFDVNIVGFFCLQLKYTCCHLSLMVSYVVPHQSLDKLLNKVCKLYNYFVCIPVQFTEYSNWRGQH